MGAPVQLNLNFQTFFQQIVFELQFDYSRYTKDHGLMASSIFALSLFEKKEAF